MKKHEPEPPRNPDSVHPPENSDFDLFLACGLALEQVEEEAERLAAATLPEFRTLVRPKPERGSKSSKGSTPPKADAPLAAARSALKALEAMRRRKSALLERAGLLRSMPLVPALCAYLAAKFVYRGDPSPYREPLPLFLPLFAPRPSAWGPLLAELETYLSGPDCLFERPREADWSPPLTQRFRLTRKAMTQLGLTPSCDGGSEKSKESELTPEESCIVELTPPKRGVGLGILALPARMMEELRTAAHFAKRGLHPQPVFLFHGPPGTGKTHAALCLAGTLRRPLTTTKIEGILSMWLGETEQRIARAFEIAKRTGALLLLDEADSLLRSRTSARASWEITQVNTLLKHLEAPPVPVVLCTNFMPSMDSALHRRITHLLSFPLPSVDDRTRIWEMEVRRHRLRGDYDLGAVAQVPLSGGLIRNAVAQGCRLRLARRKEWKSDTPSLLALAKKELEKMPEEGFRREVGFGGSWDES